MGLGRLYTTASPAYICTRTHAIPSMHTVQKHDIDASTQTYPTKGKGEAFGSTPEGCSTPNSRSLYLHAWPGVGSWF
jgi:hypothetical protein